MSIQFICDLALNVEFYFKKAFEYVFEWLINLKWYIKCTCKSLHRFQRWKSAIEMSAIGSSG